MVMVVIAYLFEVSGGGAQEDNRVVAGGGGRHGRELHVELVHGAGRDGLLAAQRRVHVQPAEVLADGMQFLPTKIVPHALASATK